MELPQSDHELVYKSRQEYERLSKAGSAEAPEACLRRGPRHINCCCCLSRRACSPRCNSGCVRARSTGDFRSFPVTHVLVMQSAEHAPGQLGTP